MNKALWLAAGILAIGGMMFAAEKQATFDDLIAKATKAQKDGKIQDAINALQEAVALLQKSQEKGIASFFPKAPDGWKAGEVKSDSSTAGSGGEAFSVSASSCEYTGKDNSNVKISLFTSPQMVEGQKAAVAALKDPQTLAAMNAGPDTKISMIDKDGWVGLRSIEKNSSAASIVAFAGQTMLEIRVNKADEKTLELFFSAINLKGLAAAVGAAKK